MWIELLSGVEDLANWLLKYEHKTHGLENFQPWNSLSVVTGSEILINLVFLFVCLHLDLNDW